MTNIIATSTALFTSTVGFSMADLIAWVQEQLLILLGGGLGVFEAIIGWILVFAIIGVILALLRKGLRFLHIVR